MDGDIVGWWSGGVTSAVACHLAIEKLKGRVRVIFIDTKNEDDDTYRFKRDCERWYGREIEVISAIPDKYENIQSVWRKYKSLNVAYGAVCSSELKRAVRIRWQKENEFASQVFGFEFSLREFKRATALNLNWPDSRPIFPLLMDGLDKKDCLRVLEDAGIVPPRAYRLGLNNNNCLKTGCVQGGIGYWQKVEKMMPDAFERMAAMEHELTEAKGRPVTIHRSKGEQVFLRPHPDYPHLPKFSDIKGRPPKPLMECNGHCGTNDLIGKDNGGDGLNLDTGEMF